MKVSPKKFKWLEQGELAEGFMAQEIKEVFPEAVHAPAEGTWALDYGRLTTLLWGAVRELSAKNDALEARLAALES